MEKRKASLKCKRVILILLFSLLIGGCGRKEKEERLVYWCGNLSICDQGLICVTGGDGKHIPITTFFDPESSVCAPICSKVNCSHDTRECDADYGDCLILYGDYLYYLASDPEGELPWDMVFMRADADGTNRKVLQHMKDVNFIPGLARCEEGYLFCPYVQDYDVDGNRLEKSRTGIWLLDLSTEKAQEIKMPDAYGTRCTRVMVSDGILYFEYVYSTVNWASYSYEELAQIDEEELRKTTRGEIWKYDPKTREKSLVCRNDEDEISFGGGRLVHKDASAEKLILEEPGGTKTWEVKLPYPSDVCLAFYRGDAIYFYAYNSGGITSYNLKSRKFKELGTVECGEGESFFIEAVTEHWVYIQKFGSDGFSGTYYMPLKDFLDGKTDWKKVTEFENKALVTLP